MGEDPPDTSDVSADLVIVGAKVITMDPNDRVAEAFAVKDGLLLTVGDTAEVLRRRGPRTNLVDLPGKVIIPGLIDVHVHVVSAAVGLYCYVDVHTPPCMSVEDLLDRLSDECARTEPGEWVVGQGNILQDLRLRERRYATKADLDRVSRKHRIAVKFGYHVTVLNSLALDTVGLMSGKVNPQHGLVVRDSDGCPTGHTVDVNDVLGIPEPGPDVKANAIRRLFSAEFLRYGITSLGDISDSVMDSELVRECSDSGRLMRISSYVRVDSYEDVDQLGRCSKGALQGLKFFVDGGLTGKAAATSYPYPDGSHGFLLWDRDELVQALQRGHELGYQPIVHAAGDRALDLLLSIYDTDLRSPPGTQPRTEHLGNPFSTASRVDRVARLGLLAVAQPSQLYSIGDSVANLFPNDMGSFMRLDRLLDAGLEVAGSSDLTSSDPDASDPFRAMWAALSRTSYDGAVFGDTGSVGIKQLLKMYTRSAAAAIGHGEDRGSLEAGKLADFAVLDQDITEIEPLDVRSVKVVQTYIGGTKVYDCIG